MDINLNYFDINTLHENSAIMVFGCVDDKKDTLSKYIMDSMDIRGCLTHRNGTTTIEHFKSKNFSEASTEESVESFLSKYLQHKQVRLEQKYEKINHGQSLDNSFESDEDVVILDKCDWHQLGKSPSFHQLITKGKYLRTTTIVFLDYPHKFSSFVRSNIDYVFILSKCFRFMRDSHILGNYVKQVGYRSKMNSLMMRVTDRQALVIDNTQSGISRLEDYIFKCNFLASGKKEDKQMTKKASKAFLKNKRAEAKRSRIRRRGTGKSTLVKDILYHVREIPVGTVISPTEEVKRRELALENQVIDEKDEVDIISDNEAPNQIEEDSDNELDDYEIITHDEVYVI